MSLKLYITRHGQTEWNIENRLQGWRDSNLTEKGIEDAVNLSERLKDVDFTHIYTSTQKRAIETAKILRRKRDIKIIELDELKEIGFGEWEGIEKEELHTIFVQRGTALNICEVKEDNIKFIVEGDTSHVR